MKNVQIINGDITSFKGDAIVNAANKYLRAGGGVCGAIFAKAGLNKLQEACDKYGTIHTGEAVITEGFNLDAKYVIHAVGPRYRESDKEGSKLLLIKTYESLFEVALSNNVKTIALPSISTGIFGYPKEEAIQVALSVIDRYKEKLDQIYIYALGSTYDSYVNKLKN